MKSWPTFCSMESVFRVSAAHLSSVCSRRAAGTGLCCSPGEAGATRNVNKARGKREFRSIPNAREYCEIRTARPPVENNLQSNVHVPPVADVNRSQKGE